MLRRRKTQTVAPNTSELGFLRLRYKEPTSAKSQLLEWPLEKAAITQNIDQTSDGFRFAAAVSAFGQLLRGGTYTEEFDYDAVHALARQSRGADDFGYRGEFLKLVTIGRDFK